MDGNFFDAENNGYGVKGWDGMRYHGQNKPYKFQEVGSETVPCKFATWTTSIGVIHVGEKVRMRLNLDTGSMYYGLGDNPYKFTFQVDKTKAYRLCVALSKNSKIILYK